MYHVERHVGLGFELSVDSRNPQMEKLREELQGRAIELADWDRLHTTLIYPSEAVMRVSSEAESIALDNARNECGRLLGRIIRPNLMLVPVSKRVERFPKRTRIMGITLDDGNNFLAGLREELAAKLYEEAGILFEQHKPFVAHVSLGRRLESKAGPRVNIRKPAIPSAFAIKGFAINQQNFSVKVSGKSHKTAKRSERRVLRPTPTRNP